MVIFAAVGGRMSLVGAVYGTLLVNFGKTYFSESFPDLWLFLMAALFIGVVMAFPKGLAGLWRQPQVKPWWHRSARRSAQRTTRPRLAAAHAAYPEALPSRAARPGPPPLPAGVSGQQRLRSTTP